MPKKITTNDFINKAVEVHGNRYFYEKVVYEKSNNKVTIVCKNHGDFLKRPSNHLQGEGCPVCGINKLSVFNLKDTKYFVEKAKLIHGNKYNYNKVEYIKAVEKVIITCKEHGDFKQQPSNHLRGQGCPTCGEIKAGQKGRSSIEKFIKNSKKIHSDKYNYENTVYKKSNICVSISCKYHGIFQQTPNNHLRGQGCPKCGNESHWKRSDYIRKANGRKTTFYILKCFNENEEFYKIGRTFKTIKNRFSGVRLPYNYSIIYEYKSDAGTIYDLENKIHKTHLKFKYQPKIKFGGSKTECYFLNLPINNINHL